MQLRNTLLVAASAAVASAATETVYLVVKSDNSAVDGNNIGFTHEGAGINYAFLSTSGQSEALTYDDDAKTLVDNIQGFPYPLSFGFAGHFVQVSVEGPNGELTFDGNTLQVNGTSSNFYACKDTNDPYQYSKNSYELMYYTEDAPSACIALTLEKSAGGASSSSSASAPSASVTSDFTGAAAANYAPAGAFAVLAGVAAALI